MEEEKGGCKGRGGDKRREEESMRKQKGKDREGEQGKRYLD